MAYGDISNSHQGRLQHVGAGRFILLVWPVWQVPISVGLDDMKSTGRWGCIEQIIFCRIPSMPCLSDPPSSLCYIKGPECWAPPLSEAVLRCLNWQLPCLAHSGGHESFTTSRKKEEQCIAKLKKIPMASKACLHSYRRLSQMSSWSDSPILYVYSFEFYIVSNSTS